MFYVNGKPFFSFGGQLHNSSSYNKEDIERAMPALKLIKANTFAAPIMWECIEAQKGVYDFTQLHNIIEVARENDLKVVILWFGSWKNGASHYVPEWIKTDRSRFIHSYEGNKINCLSPLCEDNLKDDCNALCAVAKEILRIDAQHKTVIALQINNEPGIIGADRDYSPAAEQLFNSPLPQDVITWLNEGGCGEIGDVWEENSKSTADWHSAFGLKGGEYFSAYHFAIYHEKIAKKARIIYDIPLYTNVWLNDMYWRIAASSYPSGGATANTIAMWRWFAPSLNCIAPDIYVGNPQRYEKVVDSYDRNDNPLYVPESSLSSMGGINMFTAICRKSCIGFHTFGIDSLINAAGNLEPSVADDFVKSMQIVGNALPLFAKRRGEIIPIIQQEASVNDVLDLGDYIGVVNYTMRHGKPDPGLAWFDTSHCVLRPEQAGNINTRGRGFINIVDKNEFYVAGAGFRLLLIPKTEMKQITTNFASNDWMLTRQWDYLSVEEGYLDEQESWNCIKRRNGDETDNGVWVTYDIGLVRIRMTPIN